MAKIRLWKLGDAEKRILPTQQAIDDLTNALNAWDGESDLDLVWNDLLKLEQHDTETNAVDIIVPADHDVDITVHPDQPGPTIRIFRKQEDSSVATDAY